MIKRDGRLAICFILALFAAFIAGCDRSDITTDSNGEPADVADSNPLSVTIVHVNDTHSHMETISDSLKFDGVTTYLNIGGAARMANKVANVRNSRTNTLLLHAGDAVQGTLYFNKFEGEVEIDFMNSLSFDAMVLGNHEFDKGPSLLAGLIRDAQFPMISANVNASADADLNGLIEPYVIKEIGGAKVGIFGLTTTDTATNSSPGANVAFLDEIRTASSIVDELEDQGINKIIALTHMGYDADMALAEAVDGIDVIVGGHSHTLLGNLDTVGKTAAGDYPTIVQSPSGDNVYLVASWEWAKAVGVLDVEFDSDGKVTSCNGNPVLIVDDSFRQKDSEGNKVEVDDATRASIMGIVDSSPVVEVVEEDAAVLAMLEPNRAILDAFREEVIGVAAEDLLHIRVPGTHTSGVVLSDGSHIAPHVCDGMLWKANSVGLNADVALQNAGGVRIDVPAGNITVETAYTLMPFGNTLTVLDLTGSELKQAIQAGVTKSSGAFPYVAGAHFTVDITKPEGREVTSVEIVNSQRQRTAVVDSQIYRVVTNSYVAGGQDGYVVLGDATGYRYDAGFIDAEVFMDYVREVGTLYKPQDTGLTYITTSAADVTIKVIETTDAHGSLFPYDFIEDEAIDHSLAQIYSYVREQRSAGDREVILLSGGDILQGQPIVNYYNYEKDVSQGSHIVADVMNYMGYDAGTVGNHDIEPGPEVYNAINSQLEFPWLSANTVRLSDGTPYFTPYTVVERQDTVNNRTVRVAVLGLTTPGIPKWLPQSVWQGLDFEDMIETAAYWVPYIQENENPDLIIGLFHSGFDYTYGGVTADTPRNENASQLVAQQVPGFDLICIGHDHMDRNEMVNGVRIIGAQDAADTVATATISLTWDAAAGAYTKTVAGEIVDPTVYAVDPDMMAAFDYAIQETKTYANEQIGTFSASTTSRDAMFGDSSFVDLIHELQFDVAQNTLGATADISFCAPLQFDKTIDAGPVYVRDMYKLYKYENFLYLMTLSGQEIKNFLEYSYDIWMNQMTGADDHLLNFTSYDEATGNYDLAARYYNYDSAAGILYQVDVTRAKGERVNIFGMDADLNGVADEGTTFTLDANYTVAINSYRGGGGGGHLAGAGLTEEEIEGETRKTAQTERDLRYYLMEEIRAEGTVTPTAIGHWSVIPADWASAGRETDYPILYGTGDAEH